MNRRQAVKNTVLVLGYTMTVPSLLGILSGCQSDKTKTWEPQFFSSKQGNTISELVETILPRTKTPGAKDLNIDQFIDRILFQVLPKEQKESFLQQMDAFEAEAKKVTGKSFVDASPEDRTKLLSKLEQETEKAPPSIWGINMKKDAGPLPFYRHIKELTLLGYYTSEQIGKKVLKYDPVPGEFIADMPLAQPGFISFE
jgi:hypothetical protein